MAVESASRGRELERGASAGLAASAVHLVGMFAVLAPSSDFRARLSFLAGISGPGAFLAVWALFAAAGTLVLAMGGRLTLRAVGGVSLGALGGVVLLGIGSVARAIPAGPETRPRYWLLGLAVAAAGWTVWRLRRSAGSG